MSKGPTPKPIVISSTYIDMPSDAQKFLSGLAHQAKNPLKPLKQLPGLATRRRNSDFRMLEDFSEKHNTQQLFDQHSISGPQPHFYQTR